MKPAWEIRAAAEAVTEASRSQERMQITQLIDKAAAIGCLATTSFDPLSQELQAELESLGYGVDITTLQSYSETNYQVLISWHKATKPVC